MTSSKTSGGTSKQGRETPAGNDRPAAGPCANKTQILLHDDDDMKRNPAIMEQWWPGLACMIVWAAVIVGGFVFSQCKGAEVTVAWNPNPEPDITHYRVWRGLDLLGETTDTRLRIDLPTDQVSTLTVTAHSAAGSSPHSKPLVLAPAVVHSSTDMRVWIVEKFSVFFQTLEREGIRTNRQFFRINYHIP